MNYQQHSGRLRLFEFAHSYRAVYIQIVLHDVVACKNLIGVLRSHVPRNAQLQGFVHLVRVSRGDASSCSPPRLGLPFWDSGRETAKTAENSALDGTL
jgi:hypothetical protein